MLLCGHEERSAAAKCAPRARWFATASNARRAWGNGVDSTDQGTLPARARTLYRIIRVLCRVDGTRSNFPRRCNKFCNFTGTISIDPDATQAGGKFRAMTVRLVSKRTDGMESVLAGEGDKRTPFCYSLLRGAALSSGMTVEYAESTTPFAAGASARAGVTDGDCNQKAFAIFRRHIVYGLPQSTGAEN